MVIQLQFQLKSAAMPSLIYIARIKRLSEELAQGLRAAGFHVESFKPGKITADECLLVATSEALDASLQPESSATVTGMPVERGGDLGSIPPLPNMHEQLGSQVAIWKCIKAEGGEKAGDRTSPVSPAQAAFVASSLETGAAELGFIPSEVGRRAVASSQRKSAPASERFPVMRKQFTAHPAQAGFSRLLFPRHAKSKSGGEKNRQVSRGNDWRLSHPWQVAVTVLILAAIFLIYRVSNLPATTGATSGHNASHSQSDSDSTNSLLTVSALPRRSARRSSAPLIRSSGKVPKPPAAARRHLSDNDFVAEDFTNHFDVPRQESTTLQNPDLKRNAHRGSTRKRIVVD